MSDHEEPDQAVALEQFLMDVSLQEFAQLVAEQGREFDALDFVGNARLGSGSALWADEEFQSNLLAWLLHPQESHGAGDTFLVAFLHQSGAPPKVVDADWSTAVVQREWVNLVNGHWGYLDILVLNEASSTLLAIENKVFSSEHSGQLTRYRTALAELYPNLTRHHVFLTPQGTEPYEKAERGFWMPVSYSAIIKAVRRAANDAPNPINEEVRTFLRQYATTLRRNIVPDTAIAQRARRIYLENREMMDLIIENRVNWATEAKQMLKDAIERQEAWKLDVEDAAYVRFRATEWDKFPSTQTGVGWAPRSTALMLFEFRLHDGLPSLDLALSTGNQENGPAREALFEAVHQHPESFRPTINELSDGWVVLHLDQDRILEVADHSPEWDDGPVRQKIDAWVADFAERRFPDMNRVIVDCLRDFESKQT